MNLSDVLACPPVLAGFVEAGVIDAAAVHTASALAAVLEVDDPRELLLAALAVRAPSFGHVALALDRVADLLEAESVHEVDDHVRAGMAADLGAMVAHVRSGRWVDHHCDATLLRSANQPSPGPSLAPLVVAGDLVYLDRWYHQETTVVAELLDRLAPGPDASDGAHDAAVANAVAKVFAADPTATDGLDDDPQRRAAGSVAKGRLVVVAGGPGTGKTWTVARMLAVLAALADDDHLPKVALAAPTGKAAARLVAGVHAALDAHELPSELAQHVATMAADTGVTLHRLLGLRPGRPPWHGPENPLPHHVVIVDEASMVPLALIHRLLAAMQPSARLVLVGDPDQLASVEAGSVLGDVVTALVDVGQPPVPGLVARHRPHNGSDNAGSTSHESIVTLQRPHRFGEESGIAALARAIRLGDVESTLALADSAAEVTWLADPVAARQHVQDIMVARGRRLVAAAAAGDGRVAVEVLGTVGVVAAHHVGRWGVQRLNDDVETWLSSAGLGWRSWDDLQVGRPLLVTANDAQLGVFNGDQGVLVAHEDGRVRAVFHVPRNDGDLLTVHPDRLPAHEAVHAMTIHKAQGSQWRHVVVVLPDRPSPLLTRELLYTAVTRAREHVTLVADADVIRAGVAARVQRASGLRLRLLAGLSSS